MGKISGKQLVALVVTVFVVAGIAAAMALVNSKPDAKLSNTAAVATPTPTVTASNPQATPVPATVNTIPAPAPKPSSDYPSSTSPDLHVLVLPGASDIANTEAHVTPEEIAIRNKAYAAIPIYENLAGPVYTGVYGARDELVSKGLITKNMASTAFAPEFNDYQLGLRAAKYTIQTTAMTCTLRGQSNTTVMDLGSMVCYYTRNYVDQSGSKVSKQSFVQNTSGLGAIDGTEQARLIIKLKQEDGDWKIDAIKIG